MQPINPVKSASFLQKIQWVVDPVGYMESAVKKYPDIFTAKIIGFGGTLIFINHPQALQEILTNDRKKFAAPGNVNKLLQPLVGDYSIFMLEGDRHKKGEWQQTCEKDKRLKPVHRLHSNDPEPKVEWDQPGRGDHGIGHSHHRNCQEQRPPPLRRCSAGGVAA